MKKDSQKTQIVLQKKSLDANSFTKKFSAPPQKFSDETKGFSKDANSLTKKSSDAKKKFAKGARFTPKREELQFRFPAARYRG